jgi:hypothetical protein
VVVVAFVDFVLHCWVGEDRTVGSWRGPKNPFRLPIHRVFEGQLLGFEEGRVEESLRAGEEEQLMQP